MRVLVVEDEARIASFLLKGLAAAGYAVEHVGTGAEALARVALGGTQLVVLDLRLPDMDGFDVLARLRERGDATPVIVLTARGDVHDRVRGLDLGADDYLTKPFAFDELLARVRARLRDAARPPAGDAAVLESTGLRLDARTRRVEADGAEVALTAREFALLETFMRHPGQVLSREQLLSQVWGYNFDPGTNVVDVYVGYLRKKIGARVDTVRGVGYRLRDRVPA
jgi:DNA-binding response OmpR family regulator